MNTLEEMLEKKKIDVCVYSRETQALFVNIGKNDEIRYLGKECTVSVSDGLRTKQRLALVAVTDDKLVIGCYDSSFVFMRSQIASLSAKEMAGGKYIQITVSDKDESVSMLVKRSEGKQLEAAINALGFVSRAEKPISYSADLRGLHEKKSEEGCTYLLGKPYTLNDAEIKVMVEDIENISRAMRDCSDLYEKNGNELNVSAFEKYYVPAAQKMIDAYSDYCQKQVKPDSFDLFEKRVKESLIKIRENFAALYGNMFSEQALDINKEIEALNKSFVADGLIASESDKPPKNIPFEIVVVRDGKETPTEEIPENTAE